MKLPTITRRHLKKLSTGKSIKLVRVPKGFSIKMFKDGIHYRFVKNK